jgi:hypothetical protein
MFLESGLLCRGLMDRAYLAKSCVGSAKALNSKALPDGSVGVSGSGTKWVTDLVADR